MSENQFVKDFAAANEIMHPVQDEYHYKLLTKYGFVCNTPPQKGFVRQYLYTKDETSIIVCIGASADYFDGALGFDYMSHLEEALKANEAAGH